MAATSVTAGAYRTGYEGAVRHGAGKDYHEVESDLQSAYEKSKEQGGVTWGPCQARRARGVRARPRFV